MTPLKISKKLFLKTLLASFLLAIPFYAQASVFNISLYFNPTNKVLTFDKAASAPVSLDKNAPADYVTFSENKASGTHILKLYGQDNSEIISTEFSQKARAFILKIPYFSLAKSMKIFNKSSGKEILSADLSSFSTCNGNSICEFEKGENVTTCLGDCANGHIAYSDQTKKLLEENNGTIKDPTTGQVLLQNKTLLPKPSTPTKSISQEAPPVDTGNTATKSPSTAIVILLVTIVIVIFITGIILYKKVFSKKTPDNKI